MVSSLSNLLRVAERHLHVLNRSRYQRALRQAERRKFFRVRVIAQPQPDTSRPVSSTHHRHLEGSLQRLTVAMRIRTQRLLAISERRRDRQSATEFHASHQLSVDAGVEAELTRITNREM